MRHVNARRGLFAMIAPLAMILVLDTAAEAQAPGIALPGPSQSLQSPPVASPDTAAPVQPPAPVQDEGYRLGSGDKIRVTVYGEQDLGGEFLVDGTGLVQLPLIGQIKAAGLSIHDFQAQLSDKLKEGYLKDPRVSVEVINYRPFYIIGEVNKPGEYPYVSGMNVINAVAMAGGYTYRANDSEVYVRRKGSQQEEKDPADATTRINPGDIIRVAERFF